MIHRESTFFRGACTVVMAMGMTSVAQSQKIAPSNAQRGKLTELAPGIRIDFAAAQVEVAAKVALRKGELELFACSPHTKEHESVLAVEGQPSRIFQAIGLIGLEPGKPPRYDEKTDSWLPAEGEAVELRIRYQDGGAERVVSPEAWMRRTDTKEHPQKLHWVFAGSRLMNDGRFAADIAGTVACLVDFDAALIALDASHSADNDKLWLVADPEAIPPEGTSCALLIRSAERRRIELRLESDGSLLLGGESMSLKSAVDRARGAKAENESLAITIRAAAPVPQSRIDDVTDALTGEGIAKAKITVTRLPPNPDDPEPPRRKLEKR